MTSRKAIRRAGKRVLQFCRYAESATASIGKRPVRVLVCSDGLAYTSEQQLQPLRDHRRSLRHRRIVFLETGVGAIAGWPAGLIEHFDVVAVKLQFLTPPDRVKEVAAALRRLHGRCRRIYLDGDDDNCIQWPEIVDSVDAYVKKHVFSNPCDYTREYVGKSNLTDYVHRMHGISFESDPIQRNSPLSPLQANVIELGWNLAQDEKIVTLWRHVERSPSAERTVDVVCRASAPPGSWTVPLRQPVIQALSSLHARRPILLPTERVSQARYYEEMLKSRICVSPFGYGEICWRDFEAIACGCLLVKPDMSHMRTAPDIFVPGETYVPVRWDFADLAETCEEYLARPEEIARVAGNARRVLDDWYGNECVIDRMQDLFVPTTERVHGNAI